MSSVRELANTRSAAHESRYLAFVIAASLLVHTAFWNAGIPLGDEGVHILQGLRILNGELSFNPYYLAYAALLSSVTSDPVTAHLILRFISSFASTIGLYFLLRSFSGISAVAATLSSIAWSGAALCTPYTQSGNNSIFCLAIAVPPLAYLLRSPSLTSILVYVLCTFWAASVRPEYLAPLILVPIAGFFLLRRQAPDVRPPDIRHGRPLNCLLVLGLLGSVWVTATHPGERAPFQDYLLQGLGQSYGAYYKRLHPEEAFSPMTEYQSLLDRTFGNPKSFTQALANNPSEAAKYFFDNGRANLGQLIREVLKGKRGLASITILLVATMGTLIGVWRAIPYILRAGPSQEFRNGALRVFTLLLLASASSASVILLIPDPRYWIPWVPLIYLWLAWAFDQILGPLAHRRWQYLVLALAVIVFNRPEFINKRSNKELIYSVRESVKDIDRPPIIAGNFIVGLATYAFSGRAVQINNYNGLDADALKAGRYDIWVRDGLEGTAFWNRNKRFLEAFVAMPDQFGYRLLPAGLPFNAGVYVRNTPDRGSSSLQGKLFPK